MYRAHGCGIAIATYRGHAAIENRERAAAHQWRWHHGKSKFWAWTKAQKKTARKRAAYRGAFLLAEMNQRMAWRRKKNSALAGAALTAGGGGRNRRKWRRRRHWRGENVRAKSRAAAKAA